ncbi:MULTISPECIES: S41 family peptidase [unclassified Staphylococcus]|uniref:S41 family peptidase n=1 Tax=unclassified Staphylococcus TaxID=91994 RepID=UPI0021D2BFCF|nr:MULTISPECIES: S41 family peptidase [unclassified Staphylococcus]UXR79218.1 S41 family peptidase [Staphylococcus sp. IVB6227]UXR83435.1 S41 family peptidase [Staphylococcus sp. IVB6214]
MKPKKTKTPKYIPLKYFVLSILVTIILTTVIILTSLWYWKHSTTDPSIQKNAEKLGEVYELIATDYYKNTDKSLLLEDAIKGMTKSLKDPYTEYMTTEETKSFNEDVSGDFVGIGAEMEQKDGKIYIASPIKESPAEKAGIQPRDELIAVNGHDVKGKPLTEIVKQVRGKEGTTVKLLIKRSGEKKEFSIERETIHVESVKHEKHGQTHVFKINKFQEGTADELKAAIEKAQKDGAKNILIDLRNNPGGLLDEAVDMANIFIDEGQTAVQLEKGKQKRQITTAHKPLEGIRDLNIGILINEGSASASEVFTGALKDYDVAKVYGEKSFGKGIVQTTHEFSDGSLLKYTEMKWLTPKGHYIHEKGIKPDVEVKGAAYENMTVIPTDKSFKVGDQSKYIKSIKTGLDALGYDVGQVDEHFDSTLETAIQSFQTDQKIETNGLFNRKTNEKMTEQLVKKSSEEDVMLSRTLKKLGK